VSDARRLVDRLPTVLSTQRHIVNPIAFIPRGCCRAVGDAYRKGPVGVAIKASVVQRLPRHSADALDSGDYTSVATMFDGSDLPGGKAVYPVWQHGSRRPSVGRIDLPARPVDCNALICKTLKVFHQEHDRPWPGSLNVQQVSRQQQGVNAFGQGRFKDLSRGYIRSFEKLLAKVGRHFGYARKRSLQVQIGRVNETKRRLGHGTPPCVSETGAGAAITGGGSLA
jgi:hypothetical protein